jgi:hypothetical protein
MTITSEDLRTNLMDDIKGVIEYWIELDQPCNEKISGVVHSVLCLLDGVGGFDYAVDLHCIDEHGHTVGIISTMLHEYLYPLQR